MTIHLRDLVPGAAPSPTAHIVRELQLHGYRASDGEPDSRPLPDEDVMRGALNDMFDILITTLTDTRLEPDLEDLLVDRKPLPSQRRGCGASSIATRTSNAGARTNRMARKSDRSNSSA